MAILTIMYQDKKKSIDTHEFEMTSGDVFMSTMQYLFNNLAYPLLEIDAKVHVYVNEKLKMSFYMNHKHHIHGDVIIETPEGTVRKIYKSGQLRRVVTPYGVVRFPKKMIKVCHEKDINHDV